MDVTKIDLSAARVMAGWFPVTVLLPDGTVIPEPARAYATTLGLVVYATRPRAEMGDTPDWISPIDFEQTTKPIRVTPHIGIDIHTDDGLVVITPTGSCGCRSSLKRWRPDFSQSVTAWIAPSAAN